MRFLMVLLIGLLALASEVYAYDGWTTDSVIQSYRVRPTDLVLIKVPHNNPGNCLDPAWIVLRMDDSQKSKFLYTSILSAYSTNKTVAFELLGCHEGGTNGAPIVDGIWVK